MYLLDFVFLTLECTCNSVLEFVSLVIWLSSPFYKRSLMRFQYPKLRNMAHTTPFERFHCFQRIKVIYIFYLLLLQLTLCRVAALKVSPYIIHSADYIISFGSLRSVRIFRVLKIVCLVPSSKYCFSYLTPLRHVSLI